MAKPDYIGDDWFESSSLMGQNIGTHMPPRRDAMRQPPLQMDGDVSDGAGVRTRSQEEMAKLDYGIRTLAGDPSSPAASAPATAAGTGSNVYGGIGGYQYEVRGNDIFITGTKGKKLGQPIRVDPSTAKGATAYNAIIAELAPEGVTLKPVKVPASRPSTPAGDVQITDERVPFADERGAETAMQLANQAQADMLSRKRQYEQNANTAMRGAPMAMQRANQAQADMLAEQRKGAIASMYDRME